MVRDDADQRHIVVDRLSVRAMELRRWHFIVAMVAGWLCREQDGVIHYLKEENRVLRELLGGNACASRTRNVDAWPKRARSWAAADCAA